ncbi:hypothetical protein JG688_00014027 [Phytophthora aleatoria]|uniref:Uncharacterized protein n=1 Tax=Phytophthora aleatoria TaxID=2496075 RepID=A0A8J5ME64_9STRA|nr:hypothetical protein JG688_00014027 [Phytophthora aleatoria]
MFDGWSNGSMHYVAVYGVFEADGVLRIQLLAVSPLQDLFDGVLDVYNKKLDMVAFVIGDNCSSNQSIATKLGVPRYHRIRPQIKTVEAVEELVPTGSSHRKLLVLQAHMKKFQNVTKKLHATRLTWLTSASCLTRWWRNIHACAASSSQTPRLCTLLFLRRLSSRVSTEVLCRMQRQRRSRGSRSQGVGVRGRHAKRTTRLKFSSQDRVSALRMVEVSMTSRKALC